MTKARKPATSAAPTKDMIVLVGRPAAGKTTYAQGIPGAKIIDAAKPTTFPAFLRRVENILADALPVVIVDRCNPRKDHRAKLVRAGRSNGYRVTIAHIDTPLELCDDRIRRRAGGGLPNAQAAGALMAYEDAFVAPTADEADDLQTIATDQPAASPPPLTPTEEPAAGKPAPIAADVGDKVLLLLVSGLGQAAIAEACRKIGLAAEQIPAALAAARRRLTIAADYHREREIGTAYTRLNDIYRRALAVQDAKTALAAQKELNRLLALYPQPQATGPATSDRASEEINQARAHLEPLGLAGATPGDSLPELCRLVVSRLVELEARQEAQP